MPLELPEFGNLMTQPYLANRAGTGANKPNGQIS